MRFVVEAAKVDLAAVCTPGWNSSAQKPDPKARVTCYTEHYKKLAEQRNLHAAGDALLLKNTENYGIYYSSNQTVLKINCTVFW